MFKRIINYFKNKQEKRVAILEEKRKEILKKLPENYFQRKLYSNKRLDIEIALVKIGSQVINIS